MPGSSAGGVWPNRSPPALAGIRTTTMSTTELHHVFPASLFDVPRRRRWPSRPSSSRRGYGPKWQRERALFLALHPLCHYCRRKGATARSTQIDHNPPHKGDVSQFWNVATWIPTCVPCHKHVSAKYDGVLGHPVKPRDGAYVPLQPGELDGGQDANAA